MTHPRSIQRGGVMRHNYQSLTRGAVSSFTSTHDLLSSFRNGGTLPGARLALACANLRVERRPAWRIGVAVNAFTFATPRLRHKHKRAQSRSGERINSRSLR